jgi:localization factor PodJL
MDRGGIQRVDFESAHFLFLAPTWVPFGENMQKPIPWGMRGGEAGIRDAARNAARREGLSLNAWFAQAVGEYAAEIDVDPAELTEEEHAEAIATKLRHLAASPRPGARAKARQPRIAERSARPRTRDMRSDETLLERAMRRLERSSEFDAAPAPRRNRYEPEVAARRPVVAAARRPSLANAVAEISRRQRDLEEDIPSTSHAAAYYAEALAGGATLENLRGDIAALANQVHGLRRDQTERVVAPAGCNLDKLSGEIATMSTALRGMSDRGSTAPLESAIRHLTQQIESSRGDGIRETVLQPLERLVGDLRLALAEADPRTTIRGLETEVKKLGSKLDNLGRTHVDASALNQIDARTREIRELLSGSAHSAPIERIGRQIEALNERFDQLRELQDRRPVGREDSDLMAVADEIRLLTSDRGNGAFAKLEDQLATIGAKVDLALAEARDESRYTALANRINDVHQELADRAPTPQLDIKGLERLVLGLAEKIDTAKRPEADGHAIEALQRQVSEFAARLDQANAGFPSLVSLEQTIGNLFAELERTRDASYAAAEKAARNVLDEVAQKIPSREAYDRSQDILDFRTMQDEADRRTLSTLNAVHETLEKVVDRLALVETEIADVRARPQEILASGPAPTFAPAATARMPDALSASRPALVHSVRAAAQALSEADDDVQALDDFLIEPGRGLPASRGQHMADDERANDSFDLSEASTGRAGFIAAARRAAQAAQMETATAMRNAPARAEGAGLVDQTRSFIAQHKRPVVLSVAALFLAMGAYAVVKTVGHPPLDLQPAGKVNPPGHSAPARPAAPAEHGALSMPPAAPAPRPTAALAAPAPKPASTLAPVAAPPPAAVTQPSASIGKPEAAPIFTGSIGRSVDTQPSIATLQKAAQGGSAKAQYELATDYATGHGAQRDLHLAVKWYEKAAQAGLAPAQYRLGSLYEKGLGVQRNANQAMAWYRKAADHGNVRAMHNLAVLTAEGGEGGKPDYANAAQWFRKAAEYGVKDSQYNVAILLARGLGVPQNLTLSYVWFAAAAAQGDSDAASKRDDVGAKLSPADLAAAKATAAAFRPKVPDPAANEVDAAAGGWTAPATAAKPGHPKISRL